MKRQVAIVGATPEFVRWSIRFDCSLRADTNIASVDETEKRLRAVREAGAAINAGNVHNGIAVRRDDHGQWVGFRIDDVFGPWGGCNRVQSMCGICIANPSRSKDVDLAKYRPQVAGCFGWLSPGDKQAEWFRAIEQYWPGHSETFTLQTDPLWYSIWADHTLTGNRVAFATSLFQSVAEHGPDTIRKTAREFHRVLENCQSSQLTMDVELVPAGYSDGISWTIGRHCDQCKAPFGDLAKSCRVCKKQGGGHPEIKKRVLGLRPWVPLKRVVGAGNVDEFLSKSGLEKPE